MEKWKAIPGFDNYEISSYGRIKSLYREIYKPHPYHKVLCKFRYKEKVYLGSNCGKEDTRLMFNLCKEGRVYPVIVARLVLRVFVGEPPQGMVCCHNNGNPSDNRLDNLRWDTPKSNARDRIEHGTHCCGMKSYLAKLTDDDVYSIRSYPLRRGLYKILAQYYNVSYETIRDIIKRRTWRHI